MGNQCSCQKIESEEEILSRIIRNMKLREIETKCVYYQFLNCVDSEDMIIDYFLFSNFVSQVIGNNFYKLPQTNFFENLRKRSDYLYANVKAIGIILILFSNADEKTKINFIVDYFFSFYGKLNEKTVKEFIGYIIDSQTDNCIFSFREIYSYESIKAFREIYSKNRRRHLNNVIYENFESVKLKYFGKFILNNKNESNVLYVSPKSKRNKISKYKRKAESTANPMNSIRNKIMKGFSIYNEKFNTENLKHRNVNLSKTNLLNSKKKVNFGMENKENMTSQRYSNEKENEKFYNKYIEMNYVKNSSLKNLISKNQKISYGILKETANENIKALNINATTETNIRNLKNKTEDDFNYQKNNSFLGNKCLSKEENTIGRKFSFAKVLVKEEIIQENYNENNNIIYKIRNSDDIVSAKFKSESDKSSKITILQNKLSEKLNDKIENLNYINKNNIENNIDYIDNKTNYNNNDYVDSEINQVSFCKKNSSNANNALDEQDFSNNNQEKLNVQNLINLRLQEKSSINEKLVDNKEKKISMDNEKHNIDLDTSKVISVDRMSFYSNSNSNSIKNYEKYNKGQSDKTLKTINVMKLHQKDPICLTEEKEKKTNKKIKFVNMEESNFNKIIIDPKALEKEIIRDPELSQTIFREFLELSFQLFNGDTIRNWLYDNFLKEKLNNT